jgi:hypothetical protein
MKRHSHNKNPRRGGGPLVCLIEAHNLTSSIRSKLGNVKLFQHIPNHVFSSSSAFFVSFLHLFQMLSLPEAVSAT